MIVVNGNGTMPKPPTSMAPATVFDAEGATIEVVFAVPTPLEATTGLVGSTPS